MTPKLYIALLLALTTVPALAETTNYPVFGQPVHVAQLSPEERRALRERWEQASPEEREQMRRIFQERFRKPIPDPGNLRRDGRFLPPPPGYDRWNEGSFGTGFERRRQEEPYYDDEPPREGKPDRRPDGRRR